MPSRPSVAAFPAGVQMQGLHPTVCGPPGGSHRNASHAQCHALTGVCLGVRLNDSSFDISLLIQRYRRGYPSVQQQATELQPSGKLETLNG